MAGHFAENPGRSGAPLDDPAVCRAAGVLAALDSPLRIALCRLLGRRPHVVRELVAALGRSQPLVSQHLKILRTAGIVAAERRGREVSYRLARPEVAVLIDLAAELARRIETGDETPIELRELSLAAAQPAEDDGAPEAPARPAGALAAIAPEEPAAEADPEAGALRPPC